MKFKPAIVLFFIGQALLISSWRPLTSDPLFEDDRFDILKPYLGDYPQGAINAVRLMGEGNYAAAADLFDELAEDPKIFQGRKELYYAGGKAFLAAGRTEQATAWFSDCAGYAPLFADYCLTGLAQAHRQEGRIDLAWAVIDSVIDDLIEAPIASTVLDHGIYYSFCSAHFDKSLRLSEKLLAGRLEREREAEIRLYQARSLVGLRSYEAAAQLLQELDIEMPETDAAAKARDDLVDMVEQGTIEPYDYSAQHLYDRAMSYYKVHRVRDALDGWIAIYENKVLREKNKWLVETRVYYWIGKAYEKLRENDKAIAIFDPLSQIEGSKSYGMLSKHRLANLYRRKGELKRQTDLLLWLSAEYRKNRRYGDEKKYLYLAGRSYESRMQLEDALVIYDKLLTGKPPGSIKGDILEHRAWSNYKLDRLTEAKKYYRTIAEARRVDRVSRARALYWLGRISEKKSEPKEAESYWTDSLRGDPYGYYGGLARLKLAGKEIVDPADGATATAEIAEQNIEKPDHPQIEKGLRLMAIGLAEEALDELTRAEQMLSDAPETIFAYINLLVDLGFYNRAIGLGQTHYKSLAKHFGQYNRSLLRRSVYPLAWPEHVAIGSIDGPPPELIYAIMREESAFRPKVVSAVGAIGLMQLMPYTAEELLEPGEELDISTLSDPEANINFGSEYLGRMYKRYDGKVHLAAAAYNAGPTAVDNWIEQYGDLEADEFVEFIPLSETQGYVRRVIKSYFAYKSLYDLDSIMAKYRPLAPAKEG